MTTVPEKKVTLDPGLFLGFLGGTVLVKTSYTLQRGTLDNACFDPTLKKTRDIGLCFAELEEIALDAKDEFTAPPLPNTPKHTGYLMVFELAWAGTTQNGLLIVHTPNKEEFLVFKPPPLES